MFNLSIEIKKNIEFKKKKIHRPNLSLFYHFGFQQFFWTKILVLPPIYFNLIILTEKQEAIFFLFNRPAIAFVQATDKISQRKKNVFFFCCGKKIAYFHQVRLKIIRKHTKSFQLLYSMIPDNFPFFLLFCQSVISL